MLLVLPTHNMCYLAPLPVTLKELTVHKYKDWFVEVHIYIGHLDRRGVTPAHIHHTELCWRPLTTNLVQCTVIVVAPRTYVRTISSKMLAGGFSCNMQPSFTTIYWLCVPVSFIPWVAALYPEWPYSQCIGMAYPRMRVRAPVAEASLAICSPHLHSAIRWAQGYCPV